MDESTLKNRYGVLSNTTEENKEDKNGSNTSVSDPNNMSNRTDWSKYSVTVPKNSGELPSNLTQDFDLERVQ